LIGVSGRARLQWGTGDRGSFKYGDSGDSDNDGGEDDGDGDASQIHQSK